MGKSLLILIFLAFASSIGAQTYDLNATIPVEASGNTGAKAMTLTELKGIVTTAQGAVSPTTVYAGPVSGGSAVPAFRALVSTDIPLLNQSTTATAGNVSGVVAVANGGTGGATLPTGLLKSTNGTALSAATAGSDYLAPFIAQSATAVFAGPVSGGSGVPSFRALALTDIPLLNQSTTGTAGNVSGTVAILNGGTGSTVQNFVDLSTTQASIAGLKTFTAALTSSGGLTTSGRTTIAGGLSYTTTAVGAGTGAWTLTIDGSKPSYEVTGTGSGTITLTAGLTIAVKIKCNSGAIVVNASTGETINGNPTFTVSALSNNRKLIIEAGSTTDNLALLY